MIVASRTFTGADQEWFASISGDRNPIHLDPVAARRTQAGAPVVHGIHLLLWALDSIATARPDLPGLGRLRAKFKSFVHPGDAVALELIHERSSGARLQVTVQGTTRALIAIEFGGREEACPSWLHAGLPIDTAVISPSHRDLDDVEGMSGRIGLADQEGFPAAAGWMGKRRVAAITATTYLVGMICPGLYSMYNEIDVRACSGCAGESSLAFRVVEADERFRSVDMEIAGGGMVGLVKSFALFPPVPQLSFDSVRRVVQPGEFSGSDALVVGGSRGLGELTAKILGAGGARVTVTWRSGREDAERVVRELGGEAMKFDVLDPARDAIQALSEAPTHVYYFATPSIFRPTGEVFDRRRLDEFTAVYVDAFWQLVEALRERRSEVVVFYPSSTAIDDRPRGMTEYTMAKAAGEVLCADINAAMAPTRVVVSRLPRLATDQTVTLANVESRPAMEVMLPLIREVQAGGD